MTSAANGEQPSTAIAAAALACVSAWSSIDATRDTWLASPSSLSTTDARRPRFPSCSTTARPFRFFPPAPATFVLCAIARLPKGCKDRPNGFDALPGRGPGRPRNPGRRAQQIARRTGRGKEMGGEPAGARLHPSIMMATSWRSGYGGPGGK